MTVTAVSDHPKTLILDDISRCAGRFGLGPDDPICERREQCARYVQLRLDRERHPDGYPARISVFTGLCRDDRDYRSMIPLPETEP